MAVLKETRSQEQVEGASEQEGEVMEQWVAELESNWPEGLVRVVEGGVVFLRFAQEVPGQVTPLVSHLQLLQKVRAVILVLTIQRGDLGGGVPLTRGILQEGLGPEEGVVPMLLPEGGLVLQPARAEVQPLGWVVLA